MPSWSDLGNIWTTFRELDVRPIRQEAERPLVITLVGAAGAGKTTLANSLSHHSRVGERRNLPVVEVDLQTADALPESDLIILVLDATRVEWGREAEFYTEWALAGRNLLVFYNKMDALSRPGLPETAGLPWGLGKVAFGSALDPGSLVTEFVPRVLEALPDRHLAMARRFPIFRFAVARELMSETSFANASYSLTTGLAEIIPALGIPFNVADVVILTKNQALMVYKLGLALGLSTRWQDQVAMLGGVVGAGFLWRQVARQLIGLIPLWGIVPKVAISYAGTYAVGEAVLYWYRTGHKISGQGMREIYQNALARGRQAAQGLIQRAPPPNQSSRSTLALESGKGIKCANCGKQNLGDAAYCSFCGRPVAVTMA